MDGSAIMAAVLNKTLGGNEDMSIRASPSSPKVAKKTRR